MARLLKSGKIAVKIGKETMEVLRLAVQQRLHFESLPDHLHYLLEEALERLEGKACKLRKSEFFAVFQEETMQYVDIPTQLLIRQAVELEQEPKLIAIPSSLEEQKSIPIQSGTSIVIELIRKVKSSGYYIGFITPLYHKNHSNPKIIMLKIKVRNVEKDLAIIKDAEHFLAEANQVTECGGSLKQAVVVAKYWAGVAEVLMTHGFIEQVDVFMADRFATGRRRVINESVERT